MNNLKSILISIASGIGLLILSGIWYNTKDVPKLNEKFEMVKNTNDRQDELLQQEIDHRIELEKQVLILQTKLEK